MGADSRVRALPPFVSKHRPPARFPLFGCVHRGSKVTCINRPLCIDKVPVQVVDTTYAQPAASNYRFDTYMFDAPKRVSPAAAAALRRCHAVCVTLLLCYYNLATRPKAHTCMRTDIRA